MSHTAFGRVTKRLAEQELIPDAQMFGKGYMQLIWQVPHTFTSSQRHSQGGKTIPCVTFLCVTAQQRDSVSPHLWDCADLKKVTVKKPTGAFVSHPQRCKLKIKLHEILSRLPSRPVPSCLTDRGFRKKGLVIWRNGVHLPVWAKRGQSLYLHYRDTGAIHFIWMIRSKVPDQKMYLLFHRSSFAIKASWNKNRAMRVFYFLVFWHQNFSSNYPWSSSEKPSLWRKQDFSNHLVPVQAHVILSEMPTSQNPMNRSWTEQNITLQHFIFVNLSHLDVSQCDSSLLPLLISSNKKTLHSILDFTF